MNNKVVLIGCGNVGMSYAYALLNQKTFVNELVLIDLDVERIKGEVVLPLHHLKSILKLVLTKIATMHLLFVFVLEQIKILEKQEWI